jgi:hypothetical protein
MFDSKASAKPTLLVAVAMLLGGCGLEEPIFDPATSYSPETLARDVISRFAKMSPSVKSAPARKPSGPVAKETAKGAKFKEMEATKTAEAPSLDALVEEASSKASLVSSMSRRDVLRKVAEIVAADKSLADGDRKILAERLEKAGG